MEIISLLVSVDHGLSALELAAQLEVEPDQLRDQLTKMEREGTLVRDGRSGESLDRADPEPLYRVGETVAIALEPPGTRSPSDRLPRLSRAARDALYAELVWDFAQVSDLERLAESEDPKDIEECQLIGARVLNALRLIQEGGIGWGKSSGADFVELPLHPGELARLTTDRHRLLIQFVESQRADWERDKREFDGYQEARDACGTILDQLRPALAES